MEAQPVEIVCAIAKQLPVTDLIHLLETNKRNRGIIMNCVDKLWSDDKLLRAPVDVVLQLFPKLTTTSNVILDFDKPVLTSVTRFFSNLIKKRQ